MARLLGLVDVPGFTALAVLVVFLGALNLFGLGIVGSYAWRAYENSKQRPLHVVLRQLDFEPPDRRGGAVTVEGVPHAR